jgi:hypothetical protein
MGINYNRSLWLLITLITILVITMGCAPTAISPSPGTTTTSFSPGQPVEVISVIELYNETPHPGGPAIEITLKNVSDESIISLNVTLEELGDRAFDFDFNIASSNPLTPNDQISSERWLIGGGWGGGVLYFLTINGTMESGKAFSFTWEPAD